jgi:diacylglycerol kinase (ATP)
MNLSATETCASIRVEPAMRRVALIYNPFSGQDSPQRVSAINHALESLKNAGVQAEAMVTEGPQSAGVLAREAIRNGFDSIVACGGDGTVHEILQCLVGTEIRLGVLPLGTANALAMNLGLGSDPVAAVTLLLQSVPVRVPVGQVFYRDGNGDQKASYFTVAAGVGADALFISMLDARLKRRFGYLLYLFQLVRVWATHSFPMFKATFVEGKAASPRVAHVSQLLAVRIRDFGGALRHLAPGASLRNQNLTLLAFKTRSRFDFLRFLVAVLCGRQTFLREIELLDVPSVECSTPQDSSANVLVEADGELLGSLPARIQIVPDALTLLMPVDAQP